MDLKAIGERVKALREEREWSQAELARRAKVSQQHVSFVERAKTNVSWSTLEAILGALDQKLRVGVQERGAVTVGVEVSREAADLVDAVEDLPAKDRAAVLRFARSQPAPEWVEGMVAQLLQTLENESAKRDTKAERPTRARKKG